MTSKEKIIEYSENIAALACDPSEVTEGDLGEIVKLAEKIRELVGGGEEGP